MLESRGAPTTTEEDRSQYDRRTQQFCAHGSHRIRRYGWWLWWIFAIDGDSSENGVEGRLYGEWNSRVNFPYYSRHYFGACFRLLIVLLSILSSLVLDIRLGGNYRHQRRSDSTDRITSSCGWLVHLRLTTAQIQGENQVQSNTKQKKTRSYPSFPRLGCVMVTLFEQVSANSCYHKFFVCFHMKIKDLEISRPIPNRFCQCSFSLSLWFSVPNCPTFLLDKFRYQSTVLAEYFMALSTLMLACHSLFVPHHASSVWSCCYAV